MAANFAAVSAFDQNAGQLGNIDDWSRTDQPRKWLLISGASNPPHTVEISTRRNQDNGGVLTRAMMRDARSFRHNVNYDLTNMQNCLNSTRMIWNCRTNFDANRDEVRNLIKQFFSDCQKNNWKPMLYYTGHGEIGTGNWCFSDGTIGIQEIIDWIPEGCEKPTICSDTCYSGVWANYCAQQRIEGFECLSACGDDEAALDCGGLTMNQFHFLLYEIIDCTVS